MEREKIRIHVTEPPYMRLGDNAVVENKHFILTGSTYGRVLFTDATLLLIGGRNITVQNCFFDTRGMVLSDARAGETEFV